MSALFLAGNYLMFINSYGAGAAVGIVGLTGFSEEGFKGLAWYLVTASALTAALMALISIFLYRNRVLQAKITVITGVLTLIIIAVMGIFIFIAMSEQAKPLFYLRSFIPLLNIILIILAYRSIRKDENLVKSLDRLR